MPGLGLYLGLGRGMGLVSYCFVSSRMVSSCLVWLPFSCLPVSLSRVLVFLSVCLVRLVWHAWFVEHVCVLSQVCLSWLVWFVGRVRTACPGCVVCIVCNVSAVSITRVAPVVYVVCSSVSYVLHVL